MVLKNTQRMCEFWLVRKIQTGRTQYGKSNKTIYENRPHLKEFFNFHEKSVPPFAFMENEYKLHIVIW